MNRPIPIRDLIHSANYKSVVTDAYGNSVTTTTALTRVRFEPVKKTMLSNLGESKDDKFMMFFDCTNSRPLEHVFTKLDKIEFNGVDLSIREVIPEYGTKLHHYEIVLN